MQDLRYRRAWQAVGVLCVLATAGCAGSSSNGNPSPDGGGADGGGMPVSIPLGANPSADACGAPASATLQYADVAQGHCAWKFATGLSSPRGMYVDGAGDVLVVEQGTGQVTALWDDDGNRVSDPGERAVLVSASAGLGLNHGIWVHGGYLYASSASTVYRWPYVAGSRTLLTNPQTVVHSIPSTHHVTRTLIARDSDHWLYVSVGSGSNVDPDSSRARVMRYDLDAIPAGGYDWTAGEVFADGLRNEVGLAFDAGGRLWGVQNGIDDLSRADLGGDIHDDNPAEEVNLLSPGGRFHGYPWCWTEYLLPAGVGMGPGTQWAYPATMNDGTHDDAWCRNTANVVPPALAMQAHSAPLGMVFYYASDLSPVVDGDAFVAFHGSWNRTPPTGYKVVRLLFDSPTHIARYEPFLQYQGPGDTGSNWPHRPVDVEVASDGALLVSSDKSGIIIAIAKIP